MGAVAASPSFSGARVGAVGTAPAFTGARVAAGTGTWTGNRWAGGGGRWYGGRWHRGGFWPGVAVGAALGSYAYYDGGYYDPGYYDDDYYYDTGPAVAVVPEGGDAVTYCMQRYRSYDPASGTYLGYDGLRHPCP